MRRLDRGSLRAAAFTVGIACVFLLVNSQVAYAADGGEGLLSPLNVDSSEGVPIDGYELSAQGGSVFSLKSNAYAFIMSGLFTLIRLVVGLSCWAVEFAFRFPLIKLLAAPAQKAADSYNHAVVDTLGLKGLLLAWAFAFGLVLFVRGKIGKGLGEILLTLLIAAFAASAFVRPDYLLAQDGPLAQSQQAAAEVAQATVASHDWGGKISSRGPCDGMAGHAELKCLKVEDARPLTASEIARPIEDSLTNALVVKGYMLLEYGRVLDPGKPADRTAYAVHLKWVTGGYKPGPPDEKTKRACSLVRGALRKVCEEEHAGDGKSGSVKLPDFTPGGQLLDSVTPVLSSEDAQFAAFLADMKKAGPVGKACADYAAEPSGSRAAGTFMLLVAALLICAIPLSASVVLLGTQAADAAAAAVGGVTLVWSMLPGPSRQAVWKWLALLAMSIALMFVTCMFLPFYGIGIDAVFTDGPDLPAERLLALDVVGVVGVAAHRQLLRSVTTFGQRLAVRMRYAKVGGTHLPGDSSEFGAALAVHAAGTGAGGLGGGGSLTGGSWLGTRHRIMQSVSGLTDGTGTPVPTSRIINDAGAEVSRGLAPLGLAAGGARLAARGTWGLVVGRRPEEPALERLRKPVADAEALPGTLPHRGRQSGPYGQPAAGGGRMPLRQGPSDRYRNAEGQIWDRDTGDLLHEQESDRTLLSTRAHNRLVRLRGYRAVHRTGRIAYGATLGLPRTVRTARTRSTEYRDDVNQLLRVWGHTARQDAHSWRGRP
ncbi:hypothetical protein [Streptomyces sp. NBC_01462]|uniref:hypothetical protein n=1 Tax=Streptomyces sp. NBC_01462 TaxID=2903876 RepID=UPI002E34AB5D|nr:hypothetical protein [Streptomyces sp. NBC_01462]